LIKSHCGRSTLLLTCCYALFANAHHPRFADVARVEPCAHLFVPEKYRSLSNRRAHKLCRQGVSPQPPQTNPLFLTRA
ncbi:MAG: hypothetical protein ACP5ON_03835, partial [Bacteroidota bacterium]